MWIINYVLEKSITKYIRHLAWLSCKVSSVTERIQVICKSSTEIKIFAWLLKIHRHILLGNITAPLRIVFRVLRVCYFRLRQPFIEPHTHTHMHTQPGWHIVFAMGMLLMSTENNFCFLFVGWRCCCCWCPFECPNCCWSWCRCCVEIASMASILLTSLSIKRHVA